MHFWQNTLSHLSQRTMLPPWPHHLHCSSDPSAPYTISSVRTNNVTYFHRTKRYCLSMGMSDILGWFSLQKIASEHSINCTTRANFRFESYILIWCQMAVERDTHCFFLKRSPTINARIRFEALRAIPWWKGCWRGIPSSLYKSLLPDVGVP